MDWVRGLKSGNLSVYKYLFVCEHGLSCVYMYLHPKVHESVPMTVWIRACGHVWKFVPSCAVSLYISLSRCMHESSLYVCCCVGGREQLKIRLHLFVHSRNIHLGLEQARLWICEVRGSVNGGIMPKRDEKMLVWGVPLWNSGLRRVKDPVLSGSGLDHCYGSGLTSGPWTSTCHGCSQTNKQILTNKRKEMLALLVCFEHSGKILCPRTLRGQLWGSWSPWTISKVIPIKP